MTTHSTRRSQLIHAMQWFSQRARLICLAAALALAANAPAVAQDTAKAAKAAAPAAQAMQNVFLYRTQANDTVRSIAYQFFQQPSQAQAIAVLIAANEWAGQPQSKNGFVFTAGTPVRVPTALMLQSAAPARLLQATGDVQLVGLDKTAAPAQANMAIAEGAKLVLGATGRAVVGFADESRMDIQAGSSVLFTQLRRYSHTDIYLIDVQLEQGRLEASVNPKRDLAGRFNVQSRRTVTGVRGTVFRVGDANASPAVVEVLKGEVGFSAAGATVAVPNGKGSFLEPGGAPAQPVPLLAAPQWVANASTAAPLELATPLPLRLPAGTMTVMLELTGVEAGAITRSIELKASQSLSLPADTPLGSYSLQAKAVDANGLQGLPMVRTVNFLARPFPPVGVVLSSSKSQLEWTADAQALLYAVEVFSAASASQPIIAVRTPHQFLDIAQLPAGAYRARVSTVALQPKQGDAGAQEKVGMPSAWFSFVRP